MMNRDKSSETKEEAKAPEVAAAEKVARKTVPTSADVVMPKRVAITKSAKRFERYGQVADGQELVRLVNDIAGSVEGKPTETEVTRKK